MPYLKTIHEKKSAGITAVIAVLVLLLLFLAGMKFMDPPIEYGVAVNFGTSDVGSGDVQPTEPIKSEPREVEDVPQEQSTTQPTKAAETKENVLTADNAETIAFKKQKQIEEAKAKAEADAKAAEDKKKREEADKKAKLDALMGGVIKSDGKANGGEGNDGKAGDKGQLNGSPYAPSYFGSGGGSGSGGVGYGLNGRGKPTGQIFKQDCNEEGLVVVEITVDRSGKVVKAEPGKRGTTNTATCLLEPARKIALSHRWPADNNAPAQQIGYVTVNFKLGD